MHLRRKVHRLFRPTDQDVSKSIHPRVCPLDHPPPRLKPRTFLDFLRFFSPRSDVGNEVEPVQESAHLVVIISLVKAHTLGFPCSRTRSFDGNACDRLPRYLEIVLVRFLDHTPYGYTASVGEETPL